MNDTISTVTTAVVRLVIGGAITFVCHWIRTILIPWLKEKGLYTTIRKYVLAAEKLAESDQIFKSMKRDYVIELLKKKGVEITLEIDAMIEAAVEELDLARNQIVTTFTAEEGATLEENTPNGENTPGDV